MKMMALGLVFLIFLPVGIPVTLIVIPFLAGRAGAKELPNNWHWTYILTVGGGWAIGLVVGLFVLLSLALGPSLKIDVAEPLILGIMLIFTWGSFTIGVRSTRGLPDNVDLDEEKWANEGTKTSDEQNPMAVPDEPKESTTDKLKSFFSGPKKKVEEFKKEKGKTKKPEKKKSTPKGKPSRVSALASRRRK